MQQETTPQQEDLLEVLQTLPDDDRKQAFLETQAILEELTKQAQELGLYY